MGEKIAGGNYKKASAILLLERDLQKKKKVLFIKNISRDESEFGGTELFILGFLYYNSDMNNSDGGVSKLINEMEMLEFSYEATGNAFRKLEFKKMIDIDAHFKYKEPYISLTQKGDTWCSNNERQVELYHSLIQNFVP